MCRHYTGKDALAKVALWAGDAPSCGLEGQRNEGERIMEQAWDPMRAVCRASGWHSRWVEGLLQVRAALRFVSSHLIRLTSRVR